MENLDDIIKKYSQALEEMGQVYGGEAERTTQMPPETENEETLEIKASYPSQTENAVKEVKSDETGVNTGEAEAQAADVNTEPAVREPATESAQSEPTSLASFSAAVFAGEEAFPVEGARVVVYRGDDVFALLETDINGATERVTLPAFQKENSLEAENPEQSIDYYADVFAEGFTAQKGLLVSAVGSSDIFLRVLMVPEKERIG